MSKRHRALACTLLLLLIAVDQFCKWVVMEGILKGAVGLPGSGLSAWLFTVPQEPLGFIQMRVSDFFNLVMIWNKGVNYFMPGDIQAPPLIMAGVTGAFACALAVWMLCTQDKVLMFALAAIVGGALSNIWDRVRFGGVADFFDLHLMGWHWPAFNIADAAIVLGVLAVLIDGLVFHKHRDQIKPSLSQEHS